MTNSSNLTNKVTDSRFSSYVSNCPGVTEQFSKELLARSKEMSALKSTRFSASEKAAAFKRVYENMDTAKFYAISGDSLAKRLIAELNSASERSA